MGVEAVIATQVIDTTSVGRSLMTAADAAAARTALSLGTLATQNGTISDYITAATAAATYQTILVSGTSIKTINGTSLLGSGNISVSASAAGSSGQFQYNNAGALGGTTAVVYAASGTHVAVTSQSATIVPLCCKGASGQSVNLQEWQNSSGQIMGYVSSAGDLVFQTTDGSAIAVEYARNATTSAIRVRAAGTTVLQLHGSSASATYFNAGNVAIGDTSASELLSVRSKSISTVVLGVKAASGQTANLQDWQNSSGSAILSVRANGAIMPASLADSAAANNSVYYSTTQSKLVYKDAGGVVNNLY